MLPSPSLRKSIVGTVLLFSFVPLFLLGWVVYGMFASAYHAKVRNSLAIFVEDKRNAVDLFLRDQVALLRVAAQSHSLNQLSSQEFMDRLLSIMQQGSHTIIDLGLIDDEGNHVVYSGPYNLRSINYKNEEWFKIVRVRKLYISDVFTGFRGFPHIIIAVSKQENGREWILRATINSEIFDSFVRLVQIGKKGDAYIINKKGELQTSPRFSEKNIQVIRPLIDSKFSGVRIHEGIMHGNAVYIAGIWLQEKEWLVVIEEDKHSELEPLLRTRTLTILVSAGGLLCVLLGILMVSRMIVVHQERQEREQARLNEELVQSSKMAALGKLAAGVAHEVNNPLAVIREQAGWIRDLLEEEDIQSSPNFQELRDAVIKIEQHVERAGSVVHRMLGFARRMEPVRFDVSIKDLLRETVVFLENEMHFRNIQLKWDIEEDLPLVETDPSQLQQVILNIVDNAIDAIGKNGTITLGAAYDAQSGCVCMRIRDDGPGMDKDVQARVFDPFFTTKQVGEGTGLGLSISYSIVTRLGGTIRFVSQPGEGTEFIICLPVRRGSKADDRHLGEK